MTSTQLVVVGVIAATMVPFALVTYDEYSPPWRLVPGLLVLPSVAALVAAAAGDGALGHNLGVYNLLFAATWVPFVAVASAIWVARWLRLRHVRARSAQRVFGSRDHIAAEHRMSDSEPL